MTTTLNRSFASHLLIAGAALFTSFASFAVTATPAHAATGGYQVQLAAPVEGTVKQVQNDIVWTCAGDSCRGNLGNSRAEIACARLARKVGEVAAFSANGTALDAEGLAKCNGEKTQTVARR